MTSSDLGEQLNIIEKSREQNMSAGEQLILESPRPPLKKGEHFI
jgi:hypothetical protein